MNPFRFEIGQIVFVREDLCEQYLVKPTTPCRVKSITLNSRGAFANCTYDQGNTGRSITIDINGLVLSNTRINATINSPVSA